MNTCLFCDRIIRHNHYTCTEHLPWYRQHRNEPWLQELIKMNLQQKRINMKEESIGYTDNIMASDHSTVIQRKSTKQIRNYHKTGEKDTHYHSETRGRKAVLNHSKIIKLKRYYTYIELARMFETDRRTIQLIISKKASYLIRRRSNKKSI